MDIIVAKIFFLAVAALVLAVLWTPLWTNFLYRNKLGKSIRDAESAPIMSALHAKKAGTPTMGGVIVWGTVLIVIAVCAVLGSVWPRLAWLNFLSRRETWLPLFTLVASALIGLVDDYWNVKRIGPHGGGLRMRHRLILYSAIAAVGAWWFFFKLDWSIVHLPFDGNIDLGWLYIPFFIFVIVATSFSVNNTDGLDGLAGGTLATSFAAYGAIAFYGGKYDLATFCAVIVGALIAFLWFNVNPGQVLHGRHRRDVAGRDPRRCRLSDQPGPAFADHRIHFCHRIAFDHHPAGVEEAKEEKSLPFVAFAPSSGSQRLARAKSGHAFLDHRTGHGRGRPGSRAFGQNLVK